MEAFIERLEDLKRADVIGGYEAPHPNRGLSGGMLPWVIMPATRGPARTFYTEAELEVEIKLLETFGPPLQLTGQRW